MEERPHLVFDCDAKVKAGVTDVASDERPHEFLSRSGGRAVAADVGEEAAISRSTGLQLPSWDVSCQRKQYSTFHFNKYHAKYI